MYVGVDEIITRLMSLEDTVYNNGSEMRNRDAYHESEINRLERAIEDSIPVIVHALIEHLKQQDIQEIDEGEFSLEVNRLLFGVELPF